eukprot:g15408.t1
MASTDRDALLALFETTDGPHWNKTRNWDTDAHLSVWNGVYLNGEGRVEDLYLQYNNLRGPVSLELGNLAALRVLNIGGNALIGSIPKELGDLSKLENLSLYGNQLTGPIPPELGQLTKLKMLQLHNNQLVGSIPKELGDLSKLENLSLYSNQLTGPIPPELGQLTKLKMLQVHNNKLVGPIPPELGNLAALEKLNLYRNQLEGSIPKELGALSELLQLGLSDGQLTGVIPPELGNLAALQVLHLGNNQLCGPVPLELGELRNLRELWLYNNTQLTGPIPPELGNLALLQKLELRANQLEGLRGPELHMFDEEPESAPEDSPPDPLDLTAYDELHISKEASSGKDQLDYERYAQALAELFRTGEQDVLPTAVGIFAPWGAGKSFLLGLIKKHLGADEDDTPPGLFEVWCCCLVGLANLVSRSTFFTVLRVVWHGMLTWVHSCRRTCDNASPTCCGYYPKGLRRRTWDRMSPVVDRVNPLIISSRSAREDVESAGERGGRTGKSFIFVDFNAWEYVGSEVLWAALITKIFEKVEEHPAFVPGVLTLLAFLFQMRSNGRLGGAQGVLREAASGQKSVGERHQGFMSEVKHELKILVDLINSYNRRAPKDVGTLALAITVDDLDRCPNEKIMQMLTATHLLLQQQEAPMVVFLAVDPQLIISAILDTGVEDKMKAWQYLDKIIHIPFCLPRTSRGDRLKYLRSLLHDNSCPKMLSRWMKLVEKKQKRKVSAISESKISKWKLYTPEVGATPSISWDYCRDEAIHILQQHDCALELVYRLQESRGFLTSSQSAVFDNFMIELNRVAKGERSRSATAKQVDSLLVGLMASMNDTAEDGADPDRGHPGSGSGSSPSSPSEAVETATPLSGGGAQDILEGITNIAEDSASIDADESPGEGEDNPAINIRAASPMEDNPAIHIRAISPSEDEAFAELFGIVQATPRKMKRVVNLYFLARSVAFSSSSATAALWAPERRETLVKWIMLAEFWPLRVSCILCAILKRYPDGNLPAGESGRTIASAYKDSAAPSVSVKDWIQGQRTTKELADFYSFDETEEDFLLAMKAGGETLDQEQATNCFLQHSFNLNPAIASKVKVAMAGDLRIGPYIYDEVEVKEQENVKA